LASPSARKAKVERITKETSITVEVNIDGAGNTSINTGLPFIDHLITSIGKHSMMDITLSGKSNDSIIHHLSEDVAIALSQTIDKALAERTGITRFGSAMVPMDESLAYVAIDLVKRQYHKMDIKLERESLENIPKEDLEHFCRSLLQGLNACTHMIVEYGDNDHHKVEAALKAFALAFRTAASIDPKREGVPSTKGSM
jgi:imidazoleglycerol-phosphate dehydratase